MQKIIETDRLILRRWTNNDFKPMVDINQDPKVMEYFPRTLTQEETQQLLQKIIAHDDKYGFTLYAVERKDTHEFIGFIGLLCPTFDAHFTPAVEIGWRLSSEHWGQGFAPEGAKAVLDYAFRVLDIPEIVSFTAVQNQKSRRVMEKIGMHHDVNDDFNHPNLTEESPLRRHVLYRLKQQAYVLNKINSN
ncbi:MAG: GNAT family N-acetyltransferase [Legionellaceae bacterium]|nr:GNAT family N-acetyltransferase [Legionellaceae bacterium]